MLPRRLSTLALLTAVLAACSSNAEQPARAPSAGEILKKPEQAAVKDAHFTLTAHLVSSSVALDLTGDGVIVIKPQQASRFTMQTIVQGQTLKFVEIFSDGKEYDLSPDNPRWTINAATSSNPGSFQGKNATLVGEETLVTGKAWHVKAVDANGNPFEAWVRENDGYPLKYAVTLHNGTLTWMFDKYNTGETVTPPPTSDIQS